MMEGIICGKCHNTPCNCESKETIDHPDHYRPGKFEAIKVIEAWDLNFCLGNVIKYIARCGKKDSPKKELKKAIWYLQRELSRYEK